MYVETCNFFIELTQPTHYLQRCRQAFWEKENQLCLPFAGIFNGFGVETNLVFRSDFVLRGFDLDIRKNKKVRKALRL